MDFRAERDEYQQSTTAQVANLNRDITRLRNEIGVLDEKISNIEAIEQQRHKHASIIENIDTKHDLIAQWEAALVKHETKLRANESLVDAYAAIERNQNSIDESLRTLETQKIEISEEIAAFRENHPYISSSTEQKLQIELKEKLAVLDRIADEIVYLTSLEERLNIVVKILCNLLSFLGWRTDPLAHEQERLLYVTEEIAQITQSISDYAQIEATLEQLQTQEQHISAEKLQMLHQKSTIAQLSDTRRAIEESKQTIKQLQKQIASTTKECETLTKQMHDKAFERKIAPLETLRQAQSATIKLVQEKTLTLEQINNPERVALKNTFSERLLTIATDRVAYLEKKVASRNSFFRQDAEKDPNHIANFNALTKLSEAIKKFAQSLPQGKESRLLLDISNKLILWQIAENTKHQTMAFPARMQAHQTFKEELTALIATLPNNNPLKGSKQFIQEITTPPAPAAPMADEHPQHGTTKSRGGRKS